MKVGICAIIKDCDEEYLKEFIEWHELIGVDYFFIYDNGSKTPIRQTLDGFNNIIVKEILGIGKQIWAYNDFIQSYNNNEYPKCDWVAFIDDDEFIVPENGDIKSILYEYNDFSGLGINWKQFGSSGLKHKTDEPQKYKFIMATPESYEVNRHIKSIVRPDIVDQPITPHNFSYKNGYCVNVNKEIIDGPFSNPKFEKIWINHYFCRSEEEFISKQNRGNVDTGQAKTHSLFTRDDKNSTIVDRKIIELYELLKNKSN